MFRFKRFAINQDRTAMKVGTDGVLLGAWTALNGDEKRILDIGTGTGVIALMLAQRADCESVKIDAVETDLNSAEQAGENISESPWASQITLHHIDIQSFENDKKYDLIVSNPPYFVGSLLSPDESRTTARHTTELSFSDLVESVVRLLKPSGRFSLILPVAESQLFDVEALGQLSLVRRCHVSGRAELPTKRYMSEYILSGETVQPTYERLVIELDERNKYTEEYQNLTRDFYLKF